MPSKIAFLNPVEISARENIDATWLEIIDPDGNKVSIYMPAHEARAMADAWADTQVEPEPLDAETVARRQSQTEQHIREAGRGHRLGD